MNDSLFYIIIAVAGIGLLGIMIWYYLISKRMNKEDLKYINIQRNRYNFRTRRFGRSKEN